MSPRERETDGGIEDLFTMVAEPPPAEEPGEHDAEPSRTWVGWAAKNVLLIVVATVVTVAGLRLADISVSILIIVAAFIALRLLMMAVAQVAPPPAIKVSARRAVEETGEYSWGETDSLRDAVRRWEMRLDWAQTDAERFSRSVLPVLAEITDERLRLRHGITRASDPRKARELIGDDLWRVLDDPPRRPPKKADLERYVTALERL